ncbi:tetratricopeptide repeat protein [uncultured Clostridium sp.]|uniref:tetratricopeptide repeat protein n=1 Tax=uncultured Clostridium sp. TaxID=59620 RepID=UPI0037DD23B1
MFRMFRDILRIKLPGKEKHKRILLAILVVLAIGVIAYDKLNRINEKSLENKKQEQEEIISPSNTGETKINDDIEKISYDSDKINNNTAKDEKEKYSDKENELYNEAYTSFFSHTYADAINKADLLINEFPNNSMGYNIRGIAKAYNGDYNGGMKDIDKSLSIDGNYGYARFNKALAYELYEDFDKALEWYNKDLEIEDYEWSYYGIASIYGRKGDVTNTMIYLNKAIQIDSGVKEVAKTEHDFDPVKNSEEFKRAVYN